MACQTASTGSLVKATNLSTSSNYVPNEYSPTSTSEMASDYSQIAVQKTVELYSIAKTSKMIKCNFAKLSINWVKQHLSLNIINFLWFIGLAG